MLSLQLYTNRQAQDDLTQEEDPPELQQGQDLHGQEPSQDDPAEQMNNAPQHKEAPSNSQTGRKRRHEMSAAAQRVQKLRAKRRKKQKKTPPPIDLSSNDECSQNIRPWKTIEGVNLQEEDR